MLGRGNRPGRLGEGQPPPSEPCPAPPGLSRAGFAPCPHRRQHQGGPPLLLPAGHHHRALQVLRRWSERVSGRGEDPEVGLDTIPLSHRPPQVCPPPSDGGCSPPRRMPSRVPSLRMLRSFFTDGVSAAGLGAALKQRGGFPGGADGFSPQHLPLSPRSLWTAWARRKTPVPKDTQPPTSRTCRSAP